MRHINFFKSGYTRQLKHEKTILLSTVVDISVLRFNSSCPCDPMDAGSSTGEHRSQIVTARIGYSTIRSWTPKFHTPLLGYLPENRAIKASCYAYTIY